MGKYELSVIIPLHNTDPGLFSNCVESLKNQETGFENIELIVVLHNCNEETTEGVHKLLDPFENVFLPELNNDVRSPSSPRNYGIEHATGDYLTFLDSDDTLSPECLRLALSYVKRSGADLCHFRKKIQLEEEGAITFNELVLWDQTQEMIVLDRNTWDQEKLFVGAWGMSTANLFRRELLIENNLRFDESIKFAEDYHFMLGVYGVADKICLAPQLIGYTYCVNSQSLVQTTKITEELLLDYVEGFKKVFDRGIENNIWMNDTMGSTMLIILNWMQVCPDLSMEGRQKLKTLMGPYIRSLTPIRPSKIYPSGKSDRINAFLTKYILREEPKLETFISRADEGKATTLIDRQKDALKRILRNGMNSDYSLHYGFKDIMTIEEYERRIPASDYDTYLPMIHLITQMGERGIFTDNEIISYALVKGSEGTDKRIPVTYKALVPYINALRRSIGCGKTFIMSEAKPFEACMLTMDHKYTNTIWGLLLKEYVKEAESFGSGYAAFTTPREYLFPKEQQDMSTLRLFFALKDKDVETIFAPDPDTLCICLHELENSWQSICGKTEEADSGRAKELREIFSSQTRPSLRQIWPKLEKIVCWNVTNDDALDEVKTWFKGVEFSKGYYADEYALYGKAEEENNEISLLPDDVFYEFLPLAGGDEKTVCSVADISEGEEYKLLISNLCGLYRYETGTCIKCVKKDGQQLLVEIICR